MDFGLSQEQVLLESTLRRYFEQDLPIARVRELVAKEHGADGGAWPVLAELGVAGILVPEQQGGSGLGMLDAAVAAESLAWGCAPAPFLGAAMASVAFAEAASEAQRERWLPGLASGEIRFGVAATELCSRREGAGIALREGKLEGKALMAIDAPEADWLLVPVMEGGTPGEGLALVACTATGVACTRLPTIDRTRGFAEITLDGVDPADWLARPGSGSHANRRMLDAGRVLLASDVLGASERALALAVAYAQERVQFGRVIASFQAVKHLCAEMVAELEPARSLLWYAAHVFDHQPEQASLMAAHAKAHLSEVGREIVRTATEVHGGIGFTDEQNLHFWFKRVGVDRPLLGTPEVLREDAARLQGWVS